MRPVTRRTVAPNKLAFISAFGQSLIRMTAIALVGAATMTSNARGQESGCRTGAVAAADAFVLSNPIYAYFFGELEPYINSNAEHFRAGGDAVRCLGALSGVFLRQAAQMYDPTEQSRRDEINARLGQMGISPGQPHASLSARCRNARDDVRGGADDTRACCHRTPGVATAGRYVGGRKRAVASWQNKFYCLKPGART